MPVLQSSKPILCLNYAWGLRLVEIVKLPIKIKLNFGLRLRPKENASALWTSALDVRLIQPRLQADLSEHMSTLANLVRPMSDIEWLSTDAAFGELEPMGEEVGAIAERGRGHF